MKPADDRDHNLEFLIAMSNLTDECGTYQDPPDRREELKKIVDNLNEFYADHGRMPNPTELDVTLGAGGKVEGSSELTYDLESEDSQPDYVD